MNKDDNIMREISLDDLEAVNGGLSLTPHVFGFINRQGPNKPINPVANGSETKDDIMLPATTLKEG